GAPGCGGRAAVAVAGPARHRIGVAGGARVGIGRRRCPPRGGGGAARGARPAAGPNPNAPRPLPPPPARPRPGRTRGPGPGDLAEPSQAWTAGEREAWSDVLAIADEPAPFAFTDIDPLLARAQETVEAVARRLHPEAHSAWAQFSLPELLLLTERLCRDVRREALSHIPGIRTLRLSHMLWVQRQHERYGAAGETGWRVGFGLYRLVRAALNPLQAIGQETSGVIVDKTASVLSYRLRAYATRMLVLEVGRAAIDLYSGRLRLSDEEMRAARERDA